MRTLSALALVLLAACGRDRPALPAVHDALSSAGRGGPDALVLRIPLRGGVAHVYGYAKLDSAVWTSTSAAPAVGSLLGFDGDAGMMAYVDTRGQPARLDFRLGLASLASKAPVSHLASADGSNIYGVAVDGSVVRFAPSGDWTYKPPHPARAVFPQSDGSLVVVSGRGTGAVAWKLYPPDAKIVDSVAFPTIWHDVRPQVGNLLYLAVDTGIVQLRTRTLDWGRSIDVSGQITAAVPTPSGDRVFVATADSRTVRVIDRFREAVTDRIDLPGMASDLRMDPLGRYVLARNGATDSAWVIAVGTYRVTGAVATAWRTDLPYVAPDGAIALAQDSDVVFVDGETRAPRMRVAGGARDFWYAFLWDGFRPRAAALDEPVEFNLGSADSARTDSDAVAADSAARSAAARAPAASARDTTSHAARTTGFFVSFAALLSEARARDLAAQIRVDGATAHVITSVRGGTSVYRVVLGPYPTRDAADRAGRDSRQTYWIYEDVP
ncbi:MAG TPA: SPOR domain-containing protein [Gemmatimonadaceae bacterium]|nr:SPOR domain-containing protein [Gemmatimonadaceae bacterium]